MQAGSNCSLPNLALLEVCPRDKLNVNIELENTKNSLQVTFSRILNTPGLSCSKAG